MLDNVKYIPFPDGMGFYAYCDGRQIGKITFVRTGPNIVIIDHTEVNDAYRNSDVELNLVRCVCRLAREQHRNVLPICPIARMMFNRYPEFDDVRMLRTR
jgi:predicted GNAT family acetyltransferase